MSYRVIGNDKTNLIVDDSTNRVIATADPTTEAAKTMVALANRGLEVAAEEAKRRTANAGDDWAKPSEARSSQALSDVGKVIEARGSLAKATLYYLNEAMRAARSAHAAYSPLMLELEEILRLNGADE